MIPTWVCPKWLVRRRVARMCRIAAETATERQAWDDIKAMPQRQAGDELLWPLPGPPSEPPRIFLDLACPSTDGPLSCDKRASAHKIHAAALDVDDVLGARVATWKDPARVKAGIR